MLDPTSTMVAKTGAKRFWTTREERILKETYPQGGAQACVEQLPGRSVSAIHGHANKMGLKCQLVADGSFRRRWTTSDQIDAVIRRAYQGEPRKNLVNDAARAVSRPRWWVSKRASQLGIVAPRFKEPAWTPAEIELLEANAHKHPQVVSKLFKRNGFTRSPTAITVKAKRLGATREDPNHYTGCGLAVLFGTDVKGITRWIEKGWLIAKRRGTDRTDAQGGDMWWVHRKHVRRFVVENVGAVDFRKVDKFWLVDLLAGRAIA